jgi:hypothetical protein
LLEIATKARARADSEKIELSPIPLKMLVPFLEKASLEDVDKEMQDRWAALLLSISNKYQAMHLTFVEIMSRMSTIELKFLEEVCFSSTEFPETGYPGGHFETNAKILETNANMLIVPSLDNFARSEEAHEAYGKFVRASKLTYGRIMHAGVAFIGPTGYHAGIMMCYSAAPGFTPLEILERERLVNIERLKLPATGSEIGYFNVTYLGTRFVWDCSPRSSKWGVVSVAGGTQ